MREFIELVLAFVAILIWICVLPTLGLLWLFGWLA